MTFSSADLMDVRPGVVNASKSINSQLSSSVTATVQMAARIFPKEGQQSPLSPHGSQSPCLLSLEELSLPTYNGMIWKKLWELKLLGFPVSEMGPVPPRKIRPLESWRFRSILCLIR